MASNLNTKINSYAIEKGIEFDSAYSLTPTQTGSAASMTYVLTGTTPPSYETGVGPLGGSGSWKFTTTTGSTGPAFGAPASMRTLLNDEDYSIGFWIKINTLATGTGASILFNSTAVGSTNPGFTIGVGNASHSTVAGKLYVSAAGTSLSPLATVTLGNWYYIAIVRTTNDSFKTYVNGSLASTIQLNTTIGITNGPTFGPTISAPSSWSFNIANHYVAPTSVIDAAQIAEIWTAGSTSGVTDITITETPATASVLMTEPTIAITANDHTEITTSIIASIEFPGNIVAGGDINVNNVVDPMNSTSAYIGDNVVISTGMDDSFSAEPMAASAELTEPILAQQAMTASAIMPNAIASVEANYFNLVNQLSPYLYINSGSASPTNYGTQAGTFVRGTNLSTGQDGGYPMNLIANLYSWKGSNANNSNGYFTFETTNYADSFHNLIGTGNFAYEVWVKPNQLPETTLTPDYQSSFAILNNDKLKLVLEDYYKIAIENAQGQVIGYDTQPRYFSLIINDTATTTKELRYEIDSSSFALSNWNHVVINVFQSGINANKRLVQLWINGTVVINQEINFTTWTDNANKVNYVLGSNAVSLTFLSDMYYDELAIYSEPLTNSQIIQHNQFISSMSPDYNAFPEAFLADIDSGDHQFVVTSNAIPEITVATASALFANPTVIASKVINISADPMTASAENTSATIYWGWTIYATPATAYAEKAPSYFLNDIYYQYIQSNITPYRYVTFDAADASLDYGIDNDYSVTPTSIGGTVVNPDLGINGKSVKTTGSSYITDGVILKESEWNDSWGTGQNSYHSAFWFQRAADDNSSTGLRVLWNLNGYKDNQHVVLYQYQNKLHIQFNNGSGTWVEQDSGTLDLFDYERHFVVINFNHTNPVSNIVTVYVDSVAVMTINLGAYTGSTTNAATADSGPNNEANNHPRLSVGCLITPFGSTALPVVPTNTKLIIDEIYWDKNAIDQTMVTNIYNYMPDKNNSSVAVEPMTASDEFVNPALSVSSNLSVVPATASVEAVEPIVTADREVIASATVMTADAMFADAKRFEDRLINADVFVATAVFNNAGVKITIPGGPMTASAKIVDTNITINEWPLVTMSPYVRYLRVQNYSGRKIYPMREIK